MTDLTPDARARLRDLATRYVFAILNSERIRIYEQMERLAKFQVVEEFIEAAYKEVGG